MRSWGEQGERRGAARFVIGLALAAIAGAAVPAGAGASAAADLEDRYRPGELIVAYERSTDAGERSALRRAQGVRPARALRVRTPGRVELVRLEPGESVEAAARAMSARPGVAYAEPNYLPVETAVPSDPRFGEQWALQNLGGGAFTLDADIDAPQAWEVETGGTSQVLIGVADSGIAASHEDLAGNLFTNPGDPPGGGDQDGNGYVDDTHGWDFIDGDNRPDDGDGHGTAMAGVAAAVGDNGRGMSGVSWSSRIVPLRRADAASTAEAFDYAAMIGVRVVNASFALGPSTLVEDAIARAPDTLFVASAGNAGASNEGQDVLPCTVDRPNVVCVAASTPTDELASFSNRGATTVDLAAPGEAILSTEPTWDVEAYDEDFDAGLGGWTHGSLLGTSLWGHDPTGGVNGTGALSDSPGAFTPAFSETWAQSRVFSLSGRRGCRLSQMWRGRLAPNTTLHWEFSTDGVTWRSPGFAFGVPYAFSRQNIATRGIEGSATARFRYRLVVPDNVVDEGVTLDDIRVLCLGSSQKRYADTAGTSPAAAFVSGAAALLFAKQPDLTPGEVRQRLIDTADRKPGLAGHTVSGGRLNVARLVGAPLRPENAVAPTISGTGTAGSTLTCKRGTWTERPTAYVFQWERNGVAIPGATGAGYVLTAADAGAVVTCRVTATNADGPTSATSAPRTIAPLAPDPGTPTVPSGPGGGATPPAPPAPGGDASPAPPPAPGPAPVDPGRQTPQPAPRRTATVRISVAAGQRLRRVARSGLKVSCAADRALPCRIRLLLPARTARQLGIRARGTAPVVVGSGVVRRITGRLTRGTTATVRLARAHAGRLRRARRVTLTVEARVTGVGGVTGSARRTVSLRR